MLGGSCTNDLGLGIAYALGYHFLNSRVKAIIPCGANLQDIMKIVPPSKLISADITVLSDVENPLSGPHGAAYVYTKQKDANENQIKILDEGLVYMTQLIKDQFNKDVRDMKGGGAAGGIAAGMHALFAAKIENGFNYISQLLAFEKKWLGRILLIQEKEKLMLLPSKVKL